MREWTFELWVFFWFAGLAGVLTRDLIFALADDLHRALRRHKLARQEDAYPDWVAEMEDDHNGR